MKPVHPGLQLIVIIVLALIAGTVAAEYAPTSPAVCLSVAVVLLSLNLVCRSHHFGGQIIRRNRTLLLGLTVALLASVRWTLLEQSFRNGALHQLARNGDVTVVLDAVIVSVPVENRPPTSRLDRHNDTRRRQTRFLADVTGMHTAQGLATANGRIRAFVDGPTGTRFGRGDTVRLTGQLTWPDPPGNPGEFDFEKLLRRRRCAGMVFVDHPQAVQLVHRSGPFTLGYWLTRLRRSAQHALDNAVTPEYRNIAVALLLGNRTEIAADTEDVFIGSGTMHLLAISGLHIGILCLLLVRLGHWLLIPWNRRLLLIAGFCITYALVTDLRPSVVRATLFVVLFTLSQITLRPVALSAVIGQTACLMLIWQPHLVFDTGAWLSFLSVLGLARTARGQSRDQRNDDPLRAPASTSMPLTPHERLQRAGMSGLSWLRNRYRPMLWILATTVPLTAWQFHVVSPVGLVVNVILIPWTMVTLWLGFAAVISGILLPFAVNLPGMGFTGMLAGLTSLVEAAAGVGLGHQYLPDLPPWFLPAWYLLLFSAVAVRRIHHRQLAWLGLCAVTSLTLLNVRSDDTDPKLRCTILDIGHGSAALVELPDGGVLLVDAGAMNRGDRAGELISRCLWNRGHRTIRTILVSHADVDHFNALGTIFSRFAVGELLLSQQFLHNESTAAQSLVRMAVEHGIPLRVTASGDHCSVGDTDIRVYQANQERLRAARSDNERSLMVRLQRAGTTILLPGDLEGDAMDSLLPQPGPTDVLICPHHGSRFANTPEVMRHLRPRHVVISARDTSSREHLRTIYEQAELYFTSECGAVEITIDHEGDLQLRRFRPSPHRPSGSDSE